MPTPLFILGKHRSGTTWLGNLLLDHPSITGVAHPAHCGIHESAYFSHVDGRYGDLSIRPNFVEFASVMAASDYFRLAGASFEDLLALYPSDYAGVFRTVMDRVARCSGAQYWVEKTPHHTDRLLDLARYYPDARFLGIRRNPVDVGYSWIRRQDPLPPLPRLLALVRVTVDKYIMDASMLAFADEMPERIHLVRYEELIDREEVVLFSVWQFLGVPEAPVASRYAPNSSFSSPDIGRTERASISRRSYETDVIRWLYERGLPALPERGLARFKHAWHNMTQASLPSWFFKLVEESSPQTFRNEA